jgi:uncharacterized membrane protein
MRLEAQCLIKARNGHGKSEKSLRRAPLALLWGLFDNFRFNTRGNVAVITALATLPLIAAIGCAIDYSTASSINTKLQAAADAAPGDIGYTNLSPTASVTLNGTMDARVKPAHDEVKMHGCAGRARA